MQGASLNWVVVQTSVDIVHCNCLLTFFSPSRQSFVMEGSVFLINLYWQHLILDLKLSVRLIFENGECPGKTPCFSFTLTLYFTSDLRQVDLPQIKQFSGTSWASCNSVSSDTVCLEFASDCTRAPSHKTAPSSDGSCKFQMVTCTSDQMVPVTPPALGLIIR